MAVSRKRKHAVADDQPPSKQTSAANTQKDMRAFTGISKPQKSIETSKKRKTVHEREPTPPPVIAKSAPAKADKKRKRDLESVKEESDAESDIRPQPGFFKQFTKQKIESTPRNKRFKNALPPSPAETPSKSAAALFDKLKLDANATAIPFALGKRPAGYETPPDTPDSAKASQNAPTPLEVSELCQLYAAFLSALSLYYAHNGTSSPVDVQTLLPMITKSWRKRAVTIEDLRRLFAIGGRGEDGFVLEDRGRAGICLSRAQMRGRALKRAASFVDEDELNGRFEAELLRRWSRWQDTEGAECQEAAVFVSQLPLAEIKKHASTESAAPLFARGQQRLTDIKGAQAEASASAKPSTAPADQHKTVQAIQGRGSSLLDRVLAKQALTASMPAGPTKEQLERKAALHRIEDIARVLDLLATKPRVSLSMAAVVQRVQQSLRNPISREEVERCLELMAKEVTPGFVNVIVSGAVKGVVVCRAAKVGLEELRRRVEQATS